MENENVKVYSLRRLRHGDSANQARIEKKRGGGGEGWHAIRQEQKKAGWSVKVTLGINTDEMDIEEEIWVGCGL